MEDIVSLFFAYAKLGIKTRFQYKLDSVVSSFAVFFQRSGRNYCNVFFFA